MIVIKNAEIPKSCAQCWFDKGVCCIYSDSELVGDHQANQTKSEWCPISEVVQCKDCEYFLEFEKPVVLKPWEGFCKYYNHRVLKRDFCSRGKEK